jgi:hypothetical protein
MKLSKCVLQTLLDNFHVSKSLYSSELNDASLNKNGSELNSTLDLIQKIKIVRLQHCKGKEILLESFWTAQERPGTLMLDLMTCKDQSSKLKSALIETLKFAIQRWPKLKQKLTLWTLKLI